MQEPKALTTEGPTLYESRCLLAAYAKFTETLLKGKSVWKQDGRCSANQREKSTKTAQFLTVALLHRTVPTRVFTRPKLSEKTLVEPSGITFARVLFCLKYQRRSTARTSSSETESFCKCCIASSLAARLLRGITEVQTHRRKTAEPVIAGRGAEHRNNVVTKGAVTS